MQCAPAGKPWRCELRLRSTWCCTGEHDACASGAPSLPLSHTTQQQLRARHALQASSPRPPSPPELAAARAPSCSSGRPPLPASIRRRSAEPLPCGCPRGSAWHRHVCAAAQGPHAGGGRRSCTSAVSGCPPSFRACPAAARLPGLSSSMKPSEMSSAPCICLPGTCRRERRHTFAVQRMSP